MKRHSFVQSLEGERLLELSYRSDSEEPNRGWVIDAAYLGWSAAQRFPWKVFAPLFGVVPARRVHFPFTEEGGDALGLLERKLHDGVVRVVGEVAPLADRATVLNDLWLVEPFCRIVELDDFIVIDADGQPIIVSCGLAPLLVAKPERSDLGAHRDKLDARTLDLLPNDLPEDGDVVALSLAAGMRVEVLGVARDLELSVRRATLEPASTAYRARAARPVPVVGDEDGTRLVLRVL